MSARVFFLNALFLGHWIVNLGTMLQRWSNGMLKSTLHRVVLSDAPSDRYSLPFFYEANLDACLQAWPSIVTAGRTMHKVPRDTPGDLLLDLARRDGIELVPDIQGL